MMASTGAGLDGCRNRPSSIRFEAWKTLYALEEYGAELAEPTQWTHHLQPAVRDIVARLPRTYDDRAIENAGLFR
ncbi:hypothetical protein ACIBHY_39910 [Nonomuraea sp. NPDC050547]|uniref:hypothetical protein n=1 Tax=unclassified Nonomuraea TaxID=2593643 RepID=UPI0037B2667E